METEYYMYLEINQLYLNMFENFKMQFIKNLDLLYSEHTLAETSNKSFYQNIILNPKLTKNDIDDVFKSTFEEILILSHKTFHTFAINPNALLYIDATQSLTEFVNTSPQKTCFVYTDKVLDQIWQEEPKMFYQIKYKDYIDLKTNIDSLNVTVNIPIIIELNETIKSHTIIQYSKNDVPDVKDVTNLITKSNLPIISDIHLIKVYLFKLSDVHDKMKDMQQFNDFLNSEKTVLIDTILVPIQSHTYDLLCIDSLADVKDYKKPFSKLHTVFMSHTDYPKSTTTRNTIWHILAASGNIQVTNWMCKNKYGFTKNISSKTALINSSNMNPVDIAYRKRNLYIAEQLLCFFEGTNLALEYCEYDLYDISSSKINTETSGQQISDNIKLDFCTEIELMNEIISKKYDVQDRIFDMRSTNPKIYKYLELLSSINKFTIKSYDTLIYGVNNLKQDIYVDTSNKLINVSISWKQIIKIIDENYLVAVADANLTKIAFFKQKYENAIFDYIKKNSSSSQKLDISEDELIKLIQFFKLLLTSDNVVDKLGTFFKYLYHSTFTDNNTYNWIRQFYQDENGFGYINKNNYSVGCEKWSQYMNVNKIELTQWVKINIFNFNTNVNENNLKYGDIISLIIDDNDVVPIENNVVTLNTSHTNYGYWMIRNENNINKIGDIEYGDKIVLLVYYLNTKKRKQINQNYVGLEYKKSDTKFITSASPSTFIFTHTTINGYIKNTEKNQIYCDGNYIKIENNNVKTSITNTITNCSIMKYSNNTAHIYNSNKRFNIINIHNGIISPTNTSNSIQTKYGDVILYFTPGTIDKIPIDIAFDNGTIHRSDYDNSEQVDIIIILYDNSSYYYAVLEKNNTTTKNIHKMGWVYPKNTIIYTGENKTNKQGNHFYVSSEEKIRIVQTSDKKLPSVMTDEYYIFSILGEFTQIEAPKVENKIKLDIDGENYGELILDEEFKNINAIEDKIYFIFSFYGKKLYCSIVTPTKSYTFQQSIPSIL